MNDLEARLKKAEAIILKRIKTLMDEAPYGISGFVLEFMRDPSDQKGLVTSKSKSRYYTQPNTTNRLRTLYGNLTRAVTVRGKGNTKSVEYRNGHFYLDFGYDASTVVRAGNKSTTLEYGPMNEAKDRGKSTSRARPFLEPGFNKYFQDPAGWEKLRQRFEDMVIDELTKVL